MEDQILNRVMMSALYELEREGEIVLATTRVEALANRIAAAVLEVVPNTGLSRDELIGLRMLIYHAASDKRFFDWEMPTLTGFSATEFKEIAEKLPPG